MSNFFEKRDFWGNRLSLWVVVAVAFTIPLCWWSLQHVHVEHRADQWLSNQQPDQIALRWLQQQFPVDETVQVSWEGSSINDPRLAKLVEELAGQSSDSKSRRGGSPYVSYVIDPRAVLNVMIQNEITPAAAIRTLQGTVLGAGPLRVRLTESARAALRKTRRELQLATQSKFGIELTITDGTADLSSLVTIPQATQEGDATVAVSPTVLLADGQFKEETNLEHDFQFSWPGLHVGSPLTKSVADWLMEYQPERGDGAKLVESAFFVPGTPVALEIGLSETGQSDVSETIAAIRAACIRAGVPHEAIHLTGTAILSAERDRLASKSLWNASLPLARFNERSVLLAGAMILVLGGFLFIRPLPVAAAAVAVSLFCGCSMLALGLVSGTSMTWMQIPGALLVSALTLSTALFVTKYWKSGVAAGDANPIRIAVKRSLPLISVSLLPLGMAALALSFGTLIPMRDFGIWLLAGTLISAISLALVLPSVIQLLLADSKSPAVKDSHSEPTIARLLLVHPGIQSVVTIAILVACAAGMYRLRTDSNLLSDFPARSPLRSDYQFIESNLKGTVPIEMVVRFDEQAQRDMNFLDRMEVVRQVGQQLRKQSDISGSNSLVDFYPGIEKPADDASFLLRSKYNKRASSIQEQIQNADDRLTRSFYSVCKNGQDMEVIGDNLLNRAGDEIWRVHADTMISGHTPFATILNQIEQTTQDTLRLYPGTSHRLVGELPRWNQIQLAQSQTLFSSLCISVLMTFLLSIVAIRSLAAGPLILLPIVTPLSTIAGILSWCSIPLDTGFMLGAIFAPALAATNPLSAVIRYRSQRKKGASAEESLLTTMSECFPRTAQAGLIFVASFVAMTHSDLVPINHFGLMIIATSAASMFISPILISQLLVGPLGWIFDPAAETLLKPAIVEEIAAVADAPESEAVIEAPSIPEPHIKSHASPAKKRRSTKRDLDAS